MLPGPGSHLWEQLPRCSRRVRRPACLWQPSTQVRTLWVKPLYVARLARGRIGCAGFLHLAPPCLDLDADWVVCMRLAQQLTSHKWMQCRAARGLAPFGDILGSSGMHVGGRYDGSAAHAVLDSYASDGRGSAFQTDVFGGPRSGMAMDLPPMGGSLFGAPSYPATEAPSDAAPALAPLQQFGLSAALPSFTGAGVSAPQPVSGVSAAAPADAHGFPVSIISTHLL